MIHKANRYVSCQGLTPGIFIAGTGTDVGKTYVACRLASALQRKKIKTGVFKPYAAGSRDDALLLQKAAGIEETLEAINPVYSRYPLAPWVSALLEKKRLTVTNVMRSFRELVRKYSFVIVEGIGGIEVPITKYYFVKHLIKDMRLPVIVVADAGLGTINHTLLTCNALKKLNIAITGIVLNRYTGKTIAEKTNAETLEKILRIPVLAVIRKNHSNRKVFDELSAKIVRAR